MAWYQLSTFYSIYLPPFQRQQLVTYSYVWLFPRACKISLIYVFVSFVCLHHFWVALAIKPDDEYTQRARDAIASLWSQNNVATSFWRHNNAIFASRNQRWILVNRISKQQKALVVKTLTHPHYSDVTWATWHLKSPANRLFVQQ